MDTYYYDEKGILAKGYPEGRKFVILAGSEAAGGLDDPQPSCKGHVREFRDTLIENGTLRRKSTTDKLEFTKDVHCNSPSFAASLVGANSTSMDKWKNSKGEGLEYT